MDDNMKVMLVKIWYVLFMMGTMVLYVVSVVSYFDEKHRMISKELSMVIVLIISYFVLTFVLSWTIWRCCSHIFMNMCVDVDDIGGYETQHGPTYQDL